MLQLLQVVSPWFINIKLRPLPATAELHTSAAFLFLRRHYRRIDAWCRGRCVDLAVINHHIITAIGGFCIVVFCCSTLDSLPAIIICLGSWRDTLFKG